MSVERGWRVAAAVGAVVLAVGGCTGGGTDSGATAGAVVAPDLAKAKAGLTRSRAELKQFVDSLATSAVPASRPPFGSCSESKEGLPPDACTGFDAAAPCAAGARDWPQRWGYSVNLHVTTGDVLSSGRSVITQLTGLKWQLRENPTGSGVLDVTGERNGMSVRVMVDHLPGVLNLEGYGPCVSASGEPTKG